MPFGGAWVDQPESWVNAYYTWLAWLERKRKEYKGDSDGGSDDPLALFDDDSDSADWRNVLGEH